MSADPSCPFPIVGSLSQRPLARAVPAGDLGAGPSSAFRARSQIVSELGVVKASWDREAREFRRFHIWKNI